MPGPVIQKIEDSPLWPQWLRPENASVLDPAYRAPIRAIVKLLGLDDPNQVMAVGMNTMDVGASSGGLVDLLKKYPRFTDAIKQYIAPDMPPFYSRLDEAAQALPKQTFAPKIAGLVQKGQASTEELAARNVPDFLAQAGNKPITKDAFQAHLAANPPPQLAVKTLAKSTDPAYVYAAKDIIDHLGSEQPLKALQAAYPDAPQADLVDAIRAARDPNYPAGNTKFQKHQLPGGTNYRETLITMPPVRPEQDAARAQLKGLEARLQLLYQQAEGLSRRDPEALATVWDEIMAKQTEARALSQELSKDPPNLYWSSHFTDTPNILAHTRSNTRDLPGLGSGTFLEEVQSDWHQAGKAKGYGPKMETMAYYTTPSGEVPLGYGKDEAAALANVDPGWRNMVDVKYKTRQIGEGVPNAPFKETWPDLALKHHLAESALDPNMNWLGFTSGETQAARYDLSKQISEIHYSGTNLKAYNHAGETVVNQTGITPDQLPDYIGKEAANKLLAQPKQGTLQSLTGQDLKVGGEGMHAFYDNLLPKRLEKIVKPFGGTVEQMTPNLTGNKDLTGSWMVRLTPEIKDRILKYGMSLMTGIGAAGAGLAASQPAPTPTQGDQ